VIQEGQVVLFRFPQTDQIPGKLRPALIIREIPGSFGDWLICEFDEIIREDDADFGRSGLKIASVVRISRLAVVNRKVLLGSIGDIDSERLMSIKKKLSESIIGTYQITPADGV
jgi:mRNA interferase MazF